MLPDFCFQIARYGFHVAVLILLAGNPLRAQLSPGDLSAPHAQLEGLENCTQCHSAGAKISAQNCLACHVFLKERITAGKGLHADPQLKNCVECHTEHHGRDFQLIFWKEGRENFDHARSGYRLEGAHLPLKCADCHQPENIQVKDVLLKQKKDLQRTYLGLSQDCLSCHRDEHRGQLSEDCRKCHTLQEWKPASLYDHERARFPLRGEHRKVECGKCHPTLRDRTDAQHPTFIKFTGIAWAQCSDCHQDAHQGRFGKDCKSCHDPAGWKALKSGASFDHNQTRFPLRGLHARVACESCHRPGASRQGLKFARCQDCHSDFHHGQFAQHPSGGACESCHSVNSFSPSSFTVAEHQNGAFPLRGAHLAVPCIACHAGDSGGSVPATAPRSMVKMNRFRFASADCQTCHENPHGREINSFTAGAGCNFCHGIDSWKQVNFDHSRTAFDLQGRHARVDCRSCHQPAPGAENRKSLSFSGLTAACQSCHQDAHQGQFQSVLIQAGKSLVQTDCARCHGFNDWRPDRFDHDRDAAFPLEGAHKTTACGSCHPSREVNGKVFAIFKPLDSRCSSCHGGE